MTKRKPVLGWLTAALDEIEATTPATTRLWGTERRAELRAAEDVLRALDKVELVPGKAADRLIAAVERLDHITRRTP